MTEPSNQPTVLHAEPVLAVRDVAKTVSYWTEVLGFPDHWLYGDPVVHGGVSWSGGAFIQFGLNPELAERSKGNSIWLRVRHLDELYNLHRSRAEVIAELESKPWGSAEYVIKEINGYHIHFSEPAKKQTEGKSIREWKVVEGSPTADEFKELVKAVNWGDSGYYDHLLANSFAVIAKDSEQRTIGCAFLLGDNKNFYYVRDVMVLPEWQHLGIGTAMMRSMVQWLRDRASPHAIVGLFTGDHLSPFYRQFGFMPSLGMYQTVGQLKF
jgi:GNAT superfamily N-acetyltransferase